MSFGSPPPLFRQGISSRARFIFFVVLSLVFILVDSRLNALDIVRNTISSFSTPLTELVQAPATVFYEGKAYFVSKAKMKAEIERLVEENQALVLRSARFDELTRENERLRGLVGAVKGVSSKIVTSEVIGHVADPFTRRLQINIGADEGVQVGMPVIGVFGVLGQVSRTINHLSEVTLLTDHRMKIAIVNERTNEKFILSGTGDNFLELSFVRPEADVKPGDRLLTSGLDQIYPRYVLAATVVSVDYQKGENYKRVFAIPTSKIDDVQFATVVLTNPNPTALLEENEQDPQARRRRVR